MHLRRRPREEWACVPRVVADGDHEIEPLPRHLVDGLRGTPFPGNTVRGQRLHGVRIHPSHRARSCALGLNAPGGALGASRGEQRLTDLTARRVAGAQHEHAEWRVRHADPTSSLCMTVALAGQALVNSTVPATASGTSLRSMRVKPKRRKYGSAVVVSR